jgi:hypothetical protein
MAKTPKTTAFPLIDVVRPLDADGPLISLICSTYGLSLDQPNFFEQDFLPTVLGLGGLHDRGYTVPVMLERKLKEVYSALFADSHALAEGGRPSLQIDVLPVGHRTNHAKVVLIHRKRLIRLVISSANLTHEGYRRQREIAAVLDFREGGLLPVELLRRALRGWTDVLGELISEPVRQVFDATVRQAERWTLPMALPAGRSVAVVFGGGAKPLWQNLVEAWPQGEPLLDWCICSPFWPDGASGETPFDVIARGLAERGARVEGARLHMITCADSPGAKGQPKFPFQLARRLYERGFPTRSGYVAAARLEAVREEIPEGMAEDQRELHAKWVLLRGPVTAVILMGSANFTRKGLGVVARSEAANIEACVLLTLPAEAADPHAWMPPLAEEGIIDLAAFQENQFQEPVPEENNNIPWPAFIARIEIEIRWQDGPDPVGAIRVVPHPGPHPAFAISLAPDPGEPPNVPLLSVTASTGQEGNLIGTPVDAQAVRRVLSSRVVQVCWGEPAIAVRFPVNIDEHCKSGLPSVLGVRPDEQQLLAYFHGRITEEELMELLVRRAEQEFASVLAPTFQETDRLRQLQSYLLRDFVESLFGLADTLRQSIGSPRSFEQALIGDFSPVSLAEQVVQAFRAGRRSPTAAAFQFIELIRVVAELHLEGEEPLSQGEREALEEVRVSGIARLFALAMGAAEREDFLRSCSDGDFSRYVSASLPPRLAEQWVDMVRGDTTSVAKSPSNTTTEKALR